MADSPPPPDDSIDDEIDTFDDELPDMDDDFPLDEDAPPDDEDLPEDNDLPDDIDDGPPGDDMDGPPDDSMDGLPLDNDEAPLDDDDSPDNDIVDEDDIPPDDGPPDDSMDEPPDDDDIGSNDFLSTLPEGDEEDVSDVDEPPPNDESMSLPPPTDDDTMTLPEDDTTLPPDSELGDPPPPESPSTILPSSINESPPSSSIDLDDSLDDSPDKRQTRKDRESKHGKKFSRPSMLSDGLDSKLVPSSLASIEDASEESEDDASGDQNNSQTEIENSKAAKRGSVIVNGKEYYLIQGKFEGDDFEELMVKVETNIFFVKTPMDENVIIPFDLLIDTKAKRDENDDTIFYLNQLGQLITFQANNAELVNDLFAKFPRETIVSEFEFHASSVDEEEAVEEKENPSSPIVKEDDPEPDVKVAETPAENNFFNKIDIDDPNFNIDDYEFDETGALVRKHENPKKEIIEHKLAVKSSPIGRTTLSPTRCPSFEFQSSPQQQIKGHSKREVIAAKLAKPRFSVRRIKQLCNWITSLNIWDKPVTIVSIHNDFCNGILLSRLAKTLVPSANFHINSRALTKKAALENIEKSLGVFWRTKCVNNSRIASAHEIYDGNVYKTVVTIQEIFEVYVVQPLFLQAPKMFRWYNNILKQYNAPIPNAIFSDGDLIDLWTYSQSGFAIFCLIHHLHGPVTIGEGMDMIRIDAKKLVSKPHNVNEFRENIKYVFSLLHALRIPVLYNVDDWLTYPDTEFIVYQFFVIYEKLKHRQCSLPPAQGVNAGVTSGPNGEPMVTGMVFKDTLEKGQKPPAPKKPLGVFLGTGGDSLQLLPIDTSGDSDTVYRMVCPLGLISTKVKIVHANVKSREVKSNVARKDWDASVSTEVVLCDSAQRKLDLLKQAHTPRHLKENKDTSNAKASVTRKLTRKLSQEELDAEVDKLEEAMQQSQLDMEELEDELATKYLELEEQASRLGSAEYDSRFSFLEKERASLEKERLKIQSFFADQLKKIREMTKSSKEKDKDVSRVSISSHRPAKSKKVKQAERGWNQFVNNNESHNNVFKQKNQTTNSSFLSPTKLSTYNNEKDRSMLHQQSSLAVESETKTRKPSKDEIWSNFKSKLRKANIQWMSSKSHRRGHKIQELTTPKPPLQMTPKVDANSVPKIPVKRRVEEDATSMQPGTPAYVRKKELELMQVEEARRWIVIQEEEEKLLSSMNAHEDRAPPPPPPPLETRNSSAIHLTESPIVPKHTDKNYTPYSTSQMPFLSPSPFTSTPSTNLHSNGRYADQDFDATWSWMSFPRVMKLKDRNSQREYVWTIERQEDKSYEQYIIKWHKMAEDINAMPMPSNHGEVEGFVNCQDIALVQKIQQCPSQLLIKLSPSPRSLKSSGGRTSLLLIFQTDSECSKYHDGLKLLIP